MAHDTKPIESRFKGFVHVRLRRTGLPLTLILTLPYPNLNPNPTPNPNPNPNPHQVHHGVDKLNRTDGFSANVVAKPFGF